MAATITLLKDFTGGQGAGSPDYGTYTEDHDANYVILENSFNQVVAELNALQGAGAFVNYDLVEVGDSGSPGGARPVGVIGAHSYRVSINGDTTKLDVTAGSAFVSGNTRVEQIAAALLTGPGGGAGEHYVAVDLNGFASIQTSIAQKSIDVASATWDSAAYTNVTAFQNIGTNQTDDFLATIMPDGDAHILMLDRPVTGNFITKLFLTPDARLNAIERKLQNVSTDSEGDAIGDLKLDADEVTLGTLATARGGTNRSDATPADSNMLVGAGTDTYALESGDTLRLSIGVGAADTPQFARLGLGAAADGTEELLLTRTSTVRLGAGATPTFGTTSAHDLDLLQNSSSRITLLSTGVTLKDGSASTVIEVGAADTLGFYAATPVAKQSVGGTQPVTDFGEVETVLDNLFGALATLGLLTDTRA